LKNKRKKRGPGLTVRKNRLVDREEEEVLPSWAPGGLKGKAEGGEEKGEPPEVRSLVKGEPSR